MCVCVLCVAVIMIIRCGGFCVQSKDAARRRRNPLSALGGNILEIFTQSDKQAGVFTLGHRPNGLCV